MGAYGVRQYWQAGHGIVAESLRIPPQLNFRQGYGEATAVYLECHQKLKFAYFIRSTLSWIGNLSAISVKPLSSDCCLLT